MEATLDKLKAGQSGLITAILEDGGTLSRLMEMGMVSGSIVKLERVSPFGCPLAVRVKGTSVAIRRQDAQCISLMLEPQPA
ncbi:MAG: ferrous iron transport protein A [Candidatus Omnitrophica bacterium]|nr:ferrous iron transport protein A [Candidatus Omnitrophota bacterium]MCA9432039.1 ferrous iron transport protein A [Candidatus Omnitrophota bacterium]MCA9436093.1 ferrous iron transport protein A [Candidatus Omnitrophota bacterium]MCA9441064.1 ferrous iron transport protein A [Candidatus Omnitrophota bacterium]MCB9783009.1 ferrous iron transport protein A [Candidatus Omnitrophota bacterium]